MEHVTVVSGAGIARAETRRSLVMLFVVIAWLAGPGPGAAAEPESDHSVRGLSKGVLGQLLYDGGAPDGVNGVEFSRTNVCENFVLLNPATIETVRFWPQYDSGSIWDGTVTYEIRQDDGGAPGAVIDTNTVSPISTPTGRVVLGDDEYEADFSLTPPLELDAGSYWLCMNAHSGCVDDADIWWGTTDVPTDDSFFMDPNCTGSFFSPGSNSHLGFRLFGSSRGILAYDAGNPDLLNGYEMTQYIQCDDFTLDDRTLLSLVRLWVIVDQATTWDGIGGTFEIRQDVGGAPGGVMTTQAFTLTGAPTGRSVAFGPIYDEWEYQFDVSPPLALDAGTYWLCLHMGSDCSAWLGVAWETSSPVQGGTSYADFLCDGATRKADARNPSLAGGVLAAAMPARTSKRVSADPASAIQAIDPSAVWLGTSPPPGFSSDEAGEKDVCDVVCPPDAFIENEPDCGLTFVDEGDPHDTVNGGCNSLNTLGTLYDQPVTFGVPVCGTVGTAQHPTSLTDYRDTDWYEFELYDTTAVTWQAEAETGIQLILLAQGPDPENPCTAFTSVDGSSSSSCPGPVSVTATLAAGRYWAFIASSNFTGVPCGSEYVATLTGEPAPGFLSSGGAQYAFEMYQTASPPASEDCPDAFVIQDGFSGTGSTIGATNDGSASCGTSVTSPDVWYQYTASCDGTATVSLCGSTYDTVLSVHSDCPGTQFNQIVCGDDECSLQSEVTFSVVTGRTYMIRVAGFDGATGNFTITLDELCLDYLPGDADGNGVITPGDAQAAFQCYLNGGACTFGINEHAADIWPNEGFGCVDFVDGDDNLTPRDAQRIFDLYFGREIHCP